MSQHAKSNHILYHLSVGEMQTNCYIFGSAGTKEVIIIDPGADYEKINKIIGDRSPQGFVVSGCEPKK